MKKQLLAGFTVVMLAACGPDPAANEALFSFEVTPDTSFTGLPALQSFSIGEANGEWLLLGGRTNGFHGFGSMQNFPVRMANTHVYAYNLSTKQTDSLSVDSLPDALRWQLRSTNMQHLQIADYLYICGGYGARVQGTDTAYMTFPVFTRIHVPSMIQAIHAHDYTQFRKSLVYDQNPVVRSTGGELYRMPGGEFYLVLGHDFTGRYTDGNAVQTYLNAVHAFKINETDSSVQIDTSSFRYITDNLPDSVTQFRRRDLVVAPYVQEPGTRVGVAIYGGVFTWTSSIQDGGNPWPHPIYVPAQASEPYRIDSAFSQISNVYSAPVFSMYSLLNNTMYTTVFGGLGDTLQVNDDNAAFTQAISTLSRNFTSNTTAVQYNPSLLPAYIGSEGLFVPVSGLPWLPLPGMRILEYDLLPEGKTLVGHIYGGILSNAPQWGSSNPTQASSAVYAVYINKTASAALKK